MADAYNFEFHATFAPERTYISKILELAKNNYQGTRDDISELTGIPTGQKKGKVEPHIKYANFMGLIDYSLNNKKYHISLTDLGREVYIQDKYLHEELSIWLCHYGISRAVKGAPQFSFVVREGNCGVNNSISQDLLYQKARVFFGLNYKDTEISRKLFSVVKGSYTNELFEDIHFLSWDKENPVCFHSHYATRELLFLYAYGLIDSWETLIPDKKEISMDDVLDILKFDKVFGLDGINTDEALSMMSDEGLIHINRQLYPITIIKETGKEDLISNLYSNLL